MAILSGLTLILLLILYHGLPDAECKESTLEKLLKDGKSDPEWSFYGDNGPDKWEDIGYNDCGGKHQSPIIMLLNSSYRIYLKALEFDEGYYKERNDFVFINNGKWVAMTLPEDDRPCIKGGGLLPEDDEFCFIAIIFSWSEDSVRKGGHKWGNCFMNDKPFNNTLEMQMWHTNEDATRNVVVTTVFTESWSHSYMHYGLQPIVDILYKIKYKNQTTSPKRSFSISSLFVGGLNEKDYYADFFHIYNGSIPFPPCTENTQYYLFRMRQFFIPGKSVNEFQKVLRTAKGEKEKHMWGNYRPTQEWDESPLVYDRNPYDKEPEYGCALNA